MRRLEIDDRTIGEVFHASCNELKDLCFDVALDTLLNLFDEFLKNSTKRTYLRSKDMKLPNANQKQAK